MHSFDVLHGRSRVCFLSFWFYMAAVECVFWVFGSCSILSVCNLGSFLSSKHATGKARPSRREIASQRRKNTFVWSNFEQFRVNRFQQAFDFQLNYGFWFSVFFFIFFYMKNQSEQTLRLSENRRHHVQRWSSFFCNINAHFIWRFDWNRGFGWFISFFCDQFTFHNRNIFVLQQRNNMPGLFIFSWFLS